ncbi:uncharacterized protein LOC123922906 [Trifolium pratense]|uniref:uncharacterized protein LOC123922906 n=1 Tax=Trifolium pratense TaxID=57577 RepID=UPI001E69121B|nr:uncharacterized protein LOC123922906 [Trifolium pratense]
MRRKSVAKKDKSSRTSTNPTSPSASIKKTKKKSKKSRTESRRAYTMSELHVDPLPSSDVATSVPNPAERNVDTSGKNSLNLGLNVPNPAETLGLKDPAVSEKLGKNVPNPLLLLMLILENIEDHSESDESPQPKSADKDTSADKVVNENPEVIIVNEITMSEKSIPANSEATSPEYRQVFVRGKCVKFSPTVINQYLQRSSDEVAALKVTDNEVCKVLTGDVARGLGKFIYAVGTKAKFDYGAYFFQETLSHALTYAVEKPVALPTLLCNIILEQHPDILRTGVGTSVQAGVLSRKQMIADLTEASRALEARKLKIDRVIEALKVEEAAENAEGEPDGQEGEETRGSDDDTEDLEEDSDEKKIPQPKTKMSERVWEWRNPHPPLFMTTHEYAI